MKKLLSLCLALLALAALSVAIAHWRVGDWLERQRQQLDGDGYFSLAGYSVNPLAGSLVLRDLRIAAAPTADYLSLPAVTVEGLSLAQLIGGVLPSAALTITAPRVELYRRGALYRSWAERSAERCGSSGSWADLEADRGGYLTAALRAELGESDIYGEFALAVELALAPLGELTVRGRLQTGRSDIGQLGLAVWPQLEALQLQLLPDRAALLDHYQGCANAAGQTSAEWRSTVGHWQLGPLAIEPAEPAALAVWLADPAPLSLAVARTEYSLAEWLGLAGSHRLDRGSSLALTVGGQRQPVGAVQIAQVRPSEPASEAAVESALASGYQRRSWQQLPERLGQLAAVYVAQRRQPHRGELVAVDQRGLSLLQRYSEGEVVLPLPRVSIVRVETAN